MQEAKCAARIVMNRVTERRVAAAILYFAVSPRKIPPSCDADEATATAITRRLAFRYGRNIYATRVTLERGNANK